MDPPNPGQNAPRQDHHEHLADASQAVVQRRKSACCGRMAMVICRREGGAGFAFVRWLVSNSVGVASVGLASSGQMYGAR